VKVGDLVKIHDIETSAIGIVIMPLPIYWESSVHDPWWLVEFYTLGYDHECKESELVVISASK
tara:strand:+ start:45 stop:233 length:189 start_codon:yes stop_codon:yes gene_type:complete